jgi:hypothetical protein
MDTLLFFCGNLAIFSSKILNIKYQNLKKKLFLDNDIPENGVIFLLSNIPLHITILDFAPILGVAFIKIYEKRVKILTLIANNEQNTDILLHHIKISTSLPIVIEVPSLEGDFSPFGGAVPDGWSFTPANGRFAPVGGAEGATETQKIYNFYFSRGFKVGKKTPWEKDYLIYIPFNNREDAHPLAIQPSMVMNKMLFNNLIVNFPTNLAAALSPLVQQKFEVGGNICISSVSESSGHNILTLSFRSENIVYGPEVNQFSPGAVNIPNNLLTPFSFHTHPDITTTVNNAYIAWPSSLDMAVIISSYIMFSNVLAHFVVTSEGIWVIYITPLFQKFLCDLRNSNNFDILKLIVSRLQDHFSNIEHYRVSNFVEPSLRYKIKNEFIQESNKLKINTVIAELGISYANQNVNDNFNLFKLKLLKWKLLMKRNVFLKFPYFIDPPGGFHQRFTPTCLLDNDNSPEMEIEEMDIDETFF